MTENDATAAGMYSYVLKRTNYESAFIYSEEWQKAVDEGWGYHLYQELVEFPPVMLASLKNNVPPPKHTQQSVIAFRQVPATRLEQIRRRQTQIKQQISHLEGEWHEIERESRYHLTKLKGCAAVLSPIRRLPYDVIREIAQYTLSEHPRASITQSPLNLCQTSSIWRSAALSLPQLWTTLHATVRFDRASAPSDKVSQRVVTFFERARDLPLSLYLFFKGTRSYLNDDEEELLQSFSDALSEVSNRVRRLGLGGDPLERVWSSFNWEASQWRLGQLESLHFLNEASAQSDDRTVQSTLVEWASKPISCSFTGPFMKDLEPDHYNIKWKLLTELRFTEDLTIDDVYMVFDGCINLRVAEFRVEMEDDLLSIQTSDKLEDLAITTIRPDCSISNYLSRFCFPALRTLRLSSEGGVHPSPYPPEYTGFVHIRRLFFDDSWKEQLPYMIDILRQCVTLEELAFTTCPREFTSIFEAMTWTPPGTESSTTDKSAYLLPSLRTLRIQAVPLTLLELVDVNAQAEIRHHINALTRMIDSRRPSQVIGNCKALQEVVFYGLSDWAGTDFLPADVGSYLEGVLGVCKAEGMRFHCANSQTTIEKSWFSHSFDTWPVEGRKGGYI